MYLDFFVRLVFSLLFYNTYFYDTRKKSIYLIFFFIFGIIYPIFWKNTLRWYHAYLLLYNMILTFYIFQLI